MIKGQMISKGLWASSNSPKKRMNEFVFTTTTNLFVRFLGEFEDTKKSFQKYLTFSKLNFFAETIQEWNLNYEIRYLVN